MGGIQKRSCMLHTSQTIWSWNLQYLKTLITAGKEECWVIELIRSYHKSLICKLQGYIGISVYLACIIPVDTNMSVSKNRGTPKWMVKTMEKPIKNGWFGGNTHHFIGNPHMYYNSGKVKPGGCLLPQMVATRSVALLQLLDDSRLKPWLQFFHRVLKKPSQNDRFLVEWIPPCVVDIICFCFLVNSAYVYTVSILIFYTWMQNCILYILYYFCTFGAVVEMTLYTWKLTDAFCFCSCTPLSNGK